MLHMTSRAAAVLTAALMLAAMPAAAEPTTPRPPGGDLGTCYVAPNSDFGCEGAICWCCHTDGCFICDKDFAGCQWDPGHSGLQGQLNRFNGQFQQLSPNPGFTAVPAQPGIRR